MLQPHHLFELYNSESEADLLRDAKNIFKNGCNYDIEDFEKEIIKTGYEKLIFMIRVIKARLSKISLLNNDCIKELEKKLTWLERSLEKEYKLSLTLRLIEQPLDKMILRSMTATDFANLKKALLTANCAITHDYVLEEYNFTNTLGLYYNDLDMSVMEEISSYFKIFFDDCYSLLQINSNDIFNTCLRRALRIYIELLKSCYLKNLKERKNLAKEEQERRKQYEKAMRMSKNIIGQQTLPFYQEEDILKRTIRQEKVASCQKKDNFIQQIRFQVDTSGMVNF